MHYAKLLLIFHYYNTKNHQKHQFGVALQGLKIDHNLMLQILNILFIIFEFYLYYFFLQFEWNF